jgi:Zn-dependent protease with chaperone function
MLLEVQKTNKLFEEMKSNREKIINEMLFTNSLLLKEDYYGANPLLKECDEAANRIVEKLNKDSGYNVQHSEDLRTIINNFETLFNFKKIIIAWDNDASSGNAFTVPVFLSPLNIDFKVRKGKYGIEYVKKDKVVYMSVKTGLITLLGLNGRELIAIMLHEIGHNFYKDSLSLAFKKITGVISLPYIILRKLLMQVQATRIGQFLDKVKSFLLNGIGIIVGIINTIDYILVFPVLSKILIRFTTNLVSNTKKIADLMITSFFGKGYQNEKFADNFATSYGYGAEVASSMKKMDNPANMQISEKIPKEVFNDVPFLLFIQNFYLTILSVPLAIFDPHPQTDTRILDQIRKLKSDISKHGKELGPAVTKEMEEQVKIIEKQYSELNELRKHEQYIRYIWKQFVKCLTGKEQPEDMRERIFKTKDYDYTRTLKIKKKNH